MSTDLVARGGDRGFGVQDLQCIAQNVARSRLFPGVETEQAAFTLMMLCQAEGLHPIQALRRFHIIKGRPAMRADAMQAEFQRQGGVVRWERSDAEACVARFIHPTQAPEPGIGISVTMEQMSEAGIATEMYRKYPDQMLRARAISQGVRMVLPGVVVGIYTPEEVDGFAATRTPEAGPVEAPGRPADPEVEPGPASGPTDWRAALDRRPARDAEEHKFPGDRLNPHGKDVRNWFRLVESEVAAINRAVAASRDEVHRDDNRPALEVARVVNHMATWAEKKGAEIPTRANKQGEAVRAEFGKVNAALHSLYLDANWRDPLRRALLRYLDARHDAALEGAARQAEVEARATAIADGEVWDEGRE